VVKLKIEASDYGDKYILVSDCKYLALNSAQIVRYFWFSPGDSVRFRTRGGSGQLAAPAYVCRAATALPIRLSARTLLCSVARDARPRRKIQSFLPCESRGCAAIASLLYPPHNDKYPCCRFCPSPRKWQGWTRLLLLPDNMTVSEAIIKS
jgi:hypothetical protein